MRKVTLITAAILGLALLAAPALAVERIISDTFNRATGTGIAVVQIEDNLFAKIHYKDMDRTKSFTDGDQKLRISYFRRNKVESPKVDDVRVGFQPAG